MERLLVVDGQFSLELRINRKQNTSIFPAEKLVDEKRHEKSEQTS
jgi:hypothetical protein